MDKYYEPGECIDSYIIIKRIAEGRYGIIYLAEDDNSKKVIIKQLKKDMLKKYPDKIFYEEKALKNLNDTRFPKLISKFNDINAQGYILEYIEGINFEDLVVRYDYEFKRDEIYCIADKLINIIQVLHENSIVHRDIRLPNVILKENNDIVLIDFGLSRDLDNERYVKEIDYWYLSDFLIHLFYTSYYTESDLEERPWFEELYLDEIELKFLKKLMGIDGKYCDIKDIRNDFNKIRNKD